MRISVLSLFRDSESTIYECLRRLDRLEAFTNADFEYFFYENDSSDNTLNILNKWIESKNGHVFSEKLNTPKFGSVNSEQRVQLMSYYRNKLLDLAKPLNSDFTVVFDSDVLFEEDVIERYIEYFNCMTDAVMLTPNVLQNIKCKMCDCGQDSYYDSWALINRQKTAFGLTWSCNPFYHKQDRDRWKSNKPVEVYCAFGGFVLIKSEYLSHVKWSVAKGTCEHWGLCDGLNRFGKIFVVPDIKVRIEISDSVIQSLNEASVKKVILSQNEILEKVKQ